MYPKLAFCPNNWLPILYFRVPHYEQRLRSLHYKKRFQLTLNEITPRITNVMEASREVSRSRRLRRLLEIVLALGNYMNRGARGNASGFRLTSLNRLADTKSSANKGTTLLHYLIQILEKKFKDIMRLDEDIPHVREASKVSLAELNKDMAHLRAGLRDVTKEIEFHRTQSPTANDKFVPVMREFQATATCRLAEIEDLYQDMKVSKQLLAYYIKLQQLYLCYRRDLNVQPGYLERTPQTPNQTSSSESLMLSLSPSWRPSRITRTWGSARRRKRNELSRRPSSKNWRWKGSTVAKEFCPPLTKLLTWRMGRVQRESSMTWFRH